MQTLEASSTVQALSEKQRRALISLLADEDPGVYHLIRTRLLSYGPGVEDWLRPEGLNNDPTIRRRVRELLDYWARIRADERFMEFCRCQGDGLDLEQAVFLLGQTRHPQSNTEAYLAQLDSWGEEARERTGRVASAESKLGELHQFVFKELEFDGAMLHGQDPDCSYLNRIMDKRAGNPIGLCAIYLFLARRAQLPVAGIGLPTHFICRYQSPTAEIYIDCFRRGALLTRAECIQYLLQSNESLSHIHLAPVTGRRMLLRMCRNLVATYGHLEDSEEAMRIQRYVRLLSN